MKISTNQYAQALFALVNDSSSKKSSGAVAKFAQLLVDNNDAFRADKIISEFSRLWDKSRGSIEVEIISAHELDGKTIKTLEEYIKKVSGAIELKIIKKIDKSILGGVIIKYGDRIFDAGLKSRLEKFKEAMAA